MTGRPGERIEVSRTSVAAAQVRQFVIKWAPTAGIAAAAVGAWEAYIAFGDVPNWKLPAPSAIADSFRRATSSDRGTRPQSGAA